MEEINKLNIAVQVTSAMKEVRMKSGRSIKEDVTTLSMVGGPAAQVLVRVSLEEGAAQWTGWRMASWAESKMCGEAPNGIAH